MANAFRGRTTALSLDFSTLDLSSMTNGSGLVRDCTNLATITGATVLSASACIDYTEGFSGCALDVTSVNAVVTAIEAAGTSSGTLDIDGGTNAAPTGAGAAAVTALQGRGWAVTTN